jgi:hypothetical protein
MPHHLDLQICDVGARQSAVGAMVGARLSL